MPPIDGRPSRLAAGLLVLLVTAWSAEALNRLREQYKWNSVDFLYPNQAARSAAVRLGDFIPGNAVPLDVDVYQGENGPRVFLAFPKLKPGVPATLATISNRPPRSNGGYGLHVTEGTVGDRTTAPPVSPFPDWSWHRGNDCNGLISVFRMQVDQSCGRLWALDTGRIDILNTFDRVCPSKLVLFDLRSGTGDRALRKHEFSSDVIPSGSLPVTVAVDVRASTQQACATAFAYVADVTGYGLVVYDLRADKAWRINHRHFYPYPTSGSFTIAGTTFELMDGVLGLALSPPIGQNERRLYFHALASVREAWVSTGVLRNETLFPDGDNNARDLFRLSEGERPTQAAAQAMDASGVLFFSLLGRNSLNCWVAATGSPYTERGIIELDKDDEAIQFASGLKVLPGRDGEQEVWMVTNRFQKLMAPEGLNPREDNFRVLRASVRHLVKGTKCETRQLRPQGSRGTVSFPGPTSRPRGFRPRGIGFQFSSLRPRPHHSTMSGYDVPSDSSPHYSSWWLFTFHPPPPCDTCEEQHWPVSMQSIHSTTPWRDFDA